ncbi:hypothetical protein NDA01_21680 [Trichocoleus desertorum AS-A10]|uniref:hypothetical protein n=1 Tax=Trichocoleus desertorum TaxID=1481672 RepID=UPI00329A06EC
MTPTTLAEFHGRWGDFDPHIWWHWLMLIAVIVGGAWLKNPGSKSDKPKDEDEGDRQP